MEFDIPPPPNHGNGGRNPNIMQMDDHYDQRGNGQKLGYNVSDMEDMFDDHNISGPNKANIGKNKDKDQKAKKVTKPIEVFHEGYIITKALPQRKDEKPSWARVGKRAMPFDNIKLKARVAAHQKRTGLGAVELWDRLSDNQQGVVNRIVNEKNAKEKELNAEWVLADVEKVEEDIRENFWRMGRTTTKLHVIVRRQDAVLKTAAEKIKQSKAPVYDVDEIIDLAEPVKSKDKNNSKPGNNSTKKNVNVKKNTKKNVNMVDYHSDDDDDQIVNVINMNRPVSQHRQNDFGDDNRHFANNNRFEPPYPPPPGRQNDTFDFAPPRPPQPDPFAHMGQHQPDPFADTRRQPHDAFAPTHEQPDPFAGVDIPPPGPPHGAIPIPGFHQQQHNAPPPVPMPPNSNPFMPLPEIGPQEQWGAHANTPWPQEQRLFPTARITTRAHSHSRTRSPSRRRARSESRRRHRREDEDRERQASEDRRRRRRDDQQESEIRRLKHTVEKLNNKIDKVEQWDAGSLQTSSTVSTDQDDMWSLPRSNPYDSPATSPDRTHAHRKLPPGSLHQRRDPRNEPRPKYYQDRRGPRLLEERVEIQPGYGRRDRDVDQRGRPEAAYRATRPPLTHAHTVDDYPRQPRYVPAARYVEPRMQRRLTDTPQFHEELDFDRRGRRGGVDFIKVGGGYERDFEDQRAGDRQRRRYNVNVTDDYYR